MERAPGYWSGMTTAHKVWALIAALYFGAAAYIFLQLPIHGAILFVAPGFWLVTRNALQQRKHNTLSAYTLSYLLNRASGLTRALVSTIILGTALAGLGWVSTEDLRVKAAEPTLTERASSAAATAVEATKDTTSGWAASAKETTDGWISTAKGWLSDDSEPTE